MNYGYARVSTTGQDLAAQIAALEAAGVDQLVTEAASAATGRQRPALARLVASLRPGDVLTVTRLNRLARSAVDGLNLLSAVVAKGAAFRSLAEPWADTTTPAGRLMLTVLAGFAEFDREMILERTAEGRQAAKANGVKFGRPPRLTGPQLRFILESQATTPPTPIGQLARVTGVSRSTIERALRAHAAGQVVPTAGPAQVDLEDLLAQSSPPSSDT